VRLHVEHELTGAATAVGMMLADPRYVHEKVLAAGAVDQQVDVTGDASGPFTVTTRRSLPTDQIPANVRAFVGDRLDVRQVEAWEAATPDGARVGTVAVEIAGAPVRMTGTAALTPTAGGGCVIAYDGDVRASIPLFSGAVEQAAVAAVRSALDAELRTARSWLDAPRAPGQP